jgi:peptidyl-prolyl cis-trans isomerase SDCCAG10
MSSHYTTEPPPTASVLLKTTAGPIQISLFATQTPLASRNFLQHILDGYYDSTTFHRVVPGFVIQGGDPTGTGEGGESIYDDREFEIDARTGEKVVFGDEVHSRLRFNRRGLVGMAKMGESTYGSQFFITLADVRAQLDGNCTMFGRVEGDGIYNVVRIAEAENVEGTERPMYPFKIIGAEILDLPKGEPWASMKKRERIAKRTAPHDEEMDGKVKKKAKTKNKGKTLLSFGDEEGDVDHGLAIQPKAKFNTKLINNTSDQTNGTANGEREQNKQNPTKIRSQPLEKSSNGQPQGRRPAQLPEGRAITSRRRSSPSPPPLSSPKHTSKSPEAHRRKPSFHDPTTQLPLKDPESPSRSPSKSPNPPSKSSATKLNAEIATLKASMRRTLPSAPESTRKKSALEQLIPEKSIRGRKRPRPGESAGTTSNNNDRDALAVLNAFKARLEGADRAETATTNTKHLPKGKTPTSAANGKDRGKGKSKETSTSITQPSQTSTSRDKPIPPNTQDEASEDEEAATCDLHFISNCQSCSAWAPKPTHHPLQPPEPSSSSSSSSPTAMERSRGPAPNPGSGPDSDSDADWMSHALSFAKDRLGKDLTWKRKNETELLVIDPREKAKEIGGKGGKGSRAGGEREWGGRGR